MKESSLRLLISEKKAAIYFQDMKAQGFLLFLLPLFVAVTGST